MGEDSDRFLLIMFHVIVTVSCYLLCFTGVSVPFPFDPAVNCGGACHPKNNFQGHERFFSNAPVEG